MNRKKEPVYTQRRKGAQGLYLSGKNFHEPAEKKEIIKEKQLLRNR